MTFNTAENEAVGLCVAVEALNGMVNHSLLSLLDVSAYPGEAEVRFQSRPHEELFLARLLDFAKEGADSQLTGASGSCLEVLAAATDTKSFDRENSVRHLTMATAAIRQWLDAETTLTLWIPTLDLNAQLRVPRLEFLYIAGNCAKHNLARLTGVAKRIDSILKGHGYTYPEKHLLLALDEFGDNLQEDYFVYYGTWLAELLNSLRWGVQDYLQPLFSWSYRRTGEWQYEYQYPPDIVDDVAREWFWRLLNHVRAAPHVARFQGARYMKREVLR